MIKADRVTALLLLAILALASGCGKRQPAKVDGADYEIDRSFKRGPVELRIAVSKKEITIADRLTMLIETKAESGYSVELPSFGDKLHEFGIVDYSTPAPRLEDGGTVVTRRLYELEPFLSGRYSIPPMTISFHQEGDTLQHTVESDSIFIDVRSILPEEAAGLDIKDIAPPASLPSSHAMSFIVAGAVVLGAAAAAVLLRRRKKKAAPVVPAHERAFSRLEALLAEGLIDDRRYAEFTARVADILRQYIEDRFGIRAPERTTEEFLAEAGEGLQAGPVQKEMLKAFLTHCDLVKFATLEPTAENVRNSFDTCRDFIDATKMEEVSEAAA